MPSDSEISVREVTLSDQPRWAELFRAYREFYRLARDESVLDAVWGWLHDPTNDVDGLVATDASGRIVGLAHHRVFARPSTGTTGIWIDDLFTDVTFRGQGVGRALIAELDRRASREGRSVVRWITAEDNATARRLYDQVAAKTHWVLYDLTPEH